MLADGLRKASRNLSTDQGALSVAAVRPSVCLSVPCPYKAKRCVLGIWLFYNTNWKPMQEVEASGKRDL